MNSDLINEITSLITEETKNGAVKAAESDLYNCYTWDDHSEVIKSHCYDMVEFYELVAEGDAERIANYISAKCEAYKNGFIAKIKWASLWN